MRICAFTRRSCSSSPTTRWRARAAKAAGQDIVIGLVETHGRSETVALIEGLEAVHDYMGVENMKKRDPALVAELRRANPPVAQPLVRVHEESGRKCLYLSEQMTKIIVGMTERESAPLLRFLFEHSVDPLFTYRHKWAKHDLLLWDNRSTMHLALADFDTGAHRYCVRTTILGSPGGRVMGGVRPA
jgi:taurine dioxygenase